MEVDEHVADGLEVIAPALLDALVAKKYARLTAEMSSCYV